MRRDARAHVAVNALEPFTVVITIHDGQEIAALETSPIAALKLAHEITQAALAALDAALATADTPAKRT